MVCLKVCGVKRNIAFCFPFFCFHFYWIKTRRFLVSFRAERNLSFLLPPFPKAEVFARLSFSLRPLAAAVGSWGCWSWLSPGFLGVSRYAKLLVQWSPRLLCLLVAWDQHHFFCCKNLSFWTRSTNLQEWLLGWGVRCWPLLTMLSRRRRFTHADLSLFFFFPSSPCNPSLTTAPPSCSLSPVTD